ncbi:DNA helicase [Tanacetum coccineum]
MVHFNHSCPKTTDLPLGKRAVTPSLLIVTEDSIFRYLFKEELIIGNVTRVLYTVKFQKRGLPHCHTLLWVDPEADCHNMVV